MEVCSNTVRPKNYIVGQVKNAVFRFLPADEPVFKKILFIVTSLALTNWLSSVLCQCSRAKTVMMKMTKEGSLISCYSQANIFVIKAQSVNFLLLFQHSDVSCLYS